MDTSRVGIRRYGFVRETTRSKVPPVGSSLRFDSWEMDAKKLAVFF